MNESKSSFSESGGKSRPLQIGFVPTNDCAPLVVAQESGLFEKYELQVELHRETRWSSIRDKVIYGELDAAHAPATLPFITNLALESDLCACVAGMVLSLQGNGIIVSQELWNTGVRDAMTLRDLVYQNWGRRTFTFGVVFPHSPPYLLLRKWLQQGGLVPGIDVRIVVVPPAQLFPTLKLGYLDGFCGGEPWVSLVTDAEAGRCIATSAELAPLHPEKVLMARRDFAENHASEHEGLLAALIEACSFCDQPDNRAVVSEMLSQRKYVNAPITCLEKGLADEVRGAEAVVPGSSGRNIFYRYHANEPSDAKAAWLVESLYELADESILPLPPRRTPVVRNVFRRDIYERAKTLVRNQATQLNAEAETYSAQDSIATVA